MAMATDPEPRGAGANLERVRLERLLRDAPFAVVVYEGPDHVTVLSNPRHEEMTGGRIVLGRPLLESLPELAGQPVIQALDTVFRTGIEQTARAVPARLQRDGRLQECWFDVTWQPTHDAAGQVNGVLVSSVEVTEHVLARQRSESAHAVAEHARRLTETITSNASLGLVMTDTRQRCTYINPAAERILGYTFAEIRALDRSLHDLVHHTRPDGTPYPRADCPIDRALPTRMREKGEDVFVRRDGTFYPVAFTASPLLENGVATGTIVEVEDVSERKRGERERDRLLRELRTNDARLQLVIEHSPQGVAMFDREMRYLFASRRWRKDYRLGDQELTGKRHYEVFPDVPEEWKEIHRRSLAGQTERSDGEAFRRRDGSIQWVRWECRPWHEVGGVIGGIIIFAEEITAQKNAELALRESERQFRALVDNLPELAWSAQPDGHIDFYNRRWYEYTGTTLEQMAGWGWQSVHDPDLLPGVVERWSRSIVSGEPFEMEFPLRRADGVFRWFLTRVRPLTDSQGRIVRWVGTNTDVDDVKRARTEREELVAELRNALEIREEFLSIAAHELRTPLTALQLQLQGAMRLLADSDRTSEVLAPRLHIATNQTRRLANLVNELLDVSLMSGGRLPMHLERVDLVALIGDTLERHAQLSKSAGCTIRLHAEGEVAGRWDRLRLEQLVMNLLSNAIKYGAGKPIGIRVERRGREAQFSVTDHGIGIKPEDMGRIFGRFERAVSSRNYGGLGLGLYISRQIAESHGGQIEVVSKPGRGSTFTVKLPLEPRVEGDAPQGDETARGTGTLVQD